MHIPLKSVHTFILVNGVLHRVADIFAGVGQAFQVFLGRIKRTWCFFNIRNYQYFLLRRVILSCTVCIYFLCQFYLMSETCSVLFLIAAGHTETLHDLMD